jgi:hypothetical protein
MFVLLVLDPEKLRELNYRQFIQADYQRLIICLFTCYSTKKKIVSEQQQKEYQQDAQKDALDKQSCCHSNRNPE